MTEKAVTLNLSEVVIQTQDGFVCCVAKPGTEAERILMAAMDDALDTPAPEENHNHPHHD